jgi:RNA polymerase sigma-70 factor, ECF subfamily
MPSQPEFLPLFLQAQPDLRAFIGAMVRDPVTREDIFQEVSMVLWRRFDSYDAARPFGAWARGIAARKIMESHRKRARLPDELTPEIVERVAHAFEIEDEAKAHRQLQETALRECITDLPPRSHELIQNRYAQGRAIESLAAELGMTFDALYQSLSRIRKQLRECVTRRLALLRI